MYVSNGKYRLIDRDQKKIGEQHPENFSEGKVIQEILARVKRLETNVIDPRR